MAYGQYAVTLQASHNPTYEGVPVTFTIRVEDSNGPAVGGADLCIVPVGSDFCGFSTMPLDSNGTRTISQAFSPGSYYVTAVFIAGTGPGVWFYSRTLTLVVRAAPAAVPVLSPVSLFVFGLAIAALGTVALRFGCSPR
jgi:hypothetical protein